MVVEFLLGKMRNFIMIVKNRTLKQVNSDWVSPIYIEQELDYGANEWINLTTLQDFNDNDYAIVDDGVKIGVPSQKINCYGFEFNLPETEIFSKKIEVRFLVIDGTVGGGNIKDYYIKINNNVLTPQSTFWTDQMTCIRNYSTEIYRSTVNVDGDLINDLDCMFFSSSGSSQILKALWENVQENYEDIINNTEFKNSIDIYKYWS